MKRTIYLATLILVFSSCQSKYEFWPVEKFKMDKDGLHDNELVTVLYYSRGPHDDEVDKGFYRHAVVVAQESNDTINVLTFPNPVLDNLTPSNRTLVYNDHPVVKKVVPNIDELPEEMRRRIESIDTTNISWPKYSVVARDPQFDHIADNHFKTVIGSLTRE